MYKVLINAYACSPNMGSEPGMAWNWCVNLAKYCELFIITEEEFRDKIDAVVPTLPQGKNMHFYFNPVPQKVRNMCWNQGDWRFYYYLDKWQKRTLEIARDICKREKIDVLHQLNMIGFQIHGDLWKINDIPFIWGPTGADTQFPMAYLKNQPLRYRAFMEMKMLIKKGLKQFDSNIKNAMKKASFMIAASGTSRDSLKKDMNIDAVMINETGCTLIDENSLKNIKAKDIAETMTMLWVGKMDIRKQLGLAIMSLAGVKDLNVKLKIVGSGDYKLYKQLADKLGVSSMIEWTGHVSHDEVQKLMQESELMFFTSIDEGTPHSVLEAIANHLPVLCFNTCGQGDCVSEKNGRKIELSNIDQSVKEFTEAIRYFATHRSELQKRSEACREIAEELSWDNKARQMIKLYQQAIDNFKYGLR